MEIVQVTEINKNILLNLVQAYEAEFSYITKKTPGPDGVYPLDTLIDVDHPSFLLYIDRIPVGFCIKGTCDGIHDISEFYVVPSHRFSNIGEKFALKIFQEYSGKWQVRQIEGADKATRFWRKAIGNFTSGKFIEETTQDSYWGKITRQSFES